MMLGDAQRTEGAPDPTHPDGMICSIGFTGTLEGAISISLSNQGACKIVSKMLAMEITEVSSDVTDGVGEVLNIIAGGVKKRLAAAGHDFEISVPTVIKGQDLHLAVSEDKTETQLGFALENFDFGVIMIYKSLKPEDATKQEKAGSPAGQTAEIPAESPAQENSAAPAQEQAPDEDDFAKEVADVVRNAASNPPQASEASPEMGAAPSDADPTGTGSSPSAPAGEPSKDAAAALNALVGETQDSPSGNKKGEGDTQKDGGSAQDSAPAASDSLTPKKPSQDAAAALNAFIQKTGDSSEPEPETTTPSGETPASGTPSASRPAQGTPQEERRTSLDDLIRQAGEKSKREQEKKTAVDAAASLNAMIQKEGNVSPGEGQPPAGSVASQETSFVTVPEGKFVEAIELLGKKPAEAIPAGEIKEILTLLLQAGEKSGKTGDSQVIPEVGEALAKLDRMLAKIKTPG